MSIISRLGRNVLLALFVAAIIALLMRIRSKHVSRDMVLSNDNHSSYGQQSSPYAYATLLCDDVMADAIKVLIYSIKKTSTLPFLLLVLPGVSRREELQELGAEIHEIGMLDYPFRVTAEKIAINKMCRYSKLHIWRFTQFRKIIFIDVDCLVVRSLDAAFKYPEFSAVRDAGDTFNTGLFVLEPSMDTWNKMRNTYLMAPSYNQGDQGFINWFFRNSPKLALPVRYNVVCKHKSYATWPLMRRQAKMIHYTSETKPWNFFSSSHKYWRQNFDPVMYYYWSRTYRNVARHLLIGSKYHHYQPTKLLIHVFSGRCA
jgi:glycogenin glucosyltransferase